MPTFQHFGLYFTPDHLQQAHKHAAREPFQSAWDNLTHFDYARRDTVQAALSTLLMSAFGYRVAGGREVGEDAALVLQSGLGLDRAQYATYFDALCGAVTLAHAAELLRDHPAFVPNGSKWLHAYRLFVDQFQTLPPESTIVEQIWLGFLNLVSGILLDADDRFQNGCAVFRHTIEQVRPEGYLPAAVEGGDAASFQRQFYAVAALVCMAEAAAHVGVDLWNYNFRGISVTTAAAYITYYYYYPNQWRWASLAEEPARTLFKHAGSFLEFVYHHARPQDLKLLLDEQRPLFNPALGGLTTLTHALPARERRGLFG